MSYALYKQVSFGADFGGLGTVGYQLFNVDGTSNGNRITLGVAERGAGSGTYGALVTFPAAFDGELRWDTGGAAPVFASEEINTAVTLVTSGGGAGTGTAGTMISYLDATGAAALLGQVPSNQCIAFSAASSSDQANALVLASSDIDRGARWQGRRFDPTQALEFPRMAYEAAQRVRDYGSIPIVPVGGVPPGPHDKAWDWDVANNVAFVPQNVLLAVLYQADSILEGRRKERLDEIHDGVRQHGNSGMSETYAVTEGNRTGLCRRSWRLMWEYRLVAGRVL